VVLAVLVEVETEGPYQHRELLGLQTRAVAVVVGQTIHRWLVLVVPVLSSSNTQTPTAQPSAVVSHKPPQPQAATKSAQ